MNYILYNPKSNSENNDLNIIPGKAELEKRGTKQINLLEVVLREFLDTLTDSDKVYLCGGDGTLHHFANNARGFSFPCPVYVIRSGTGNDFLNDIGQTDPNTLFDVREHIANLPEVEIDGKKQLFINGVGMGIDGEVCAGVEEYKKKTGKKANYTAIALKLLAYKYKRPSATVTIDGVTHHFNNVWMAGAMHGRYFGGGMMVAPMQDRTTGKMNVMVMHGGTRAKILTIFPLIFKGGHVKHKDIVEIFECDEVTVTFDIPIGFQADGEVTPKMTTYTARSANLVKRLEEEKNSALAGVTEE